MSFDAQESQNPTKRLKQLSILDIFQKKSKKRRLTTDGEMSSRKRASLLPGTGADRHDDMDTIIDLEEEVTDKALQEATVIPHHEGREDAVSKLNTVNGPDTSNLPQTCSDCNVTSKCAEVEGPWDNSDKHCDSNIDLAAEHTGDGRIVAEVDSDIQNAKPVDDNHIKLKKEFAPAFTNKKALDIVKRSSSGDSPRHSQESDDLYETIMRNKHDANRKCLSTEIKEDSDLSQETQLHVPSPKPTIKEPESSAVEIYESPDMFESFPSLENDKDFEEEDSSSKWLGMPKSRLKVAPGCLLPLPELKQSRNHTVLFDTSYFDLGPPPPSFPSYKDAWDSVHVKLPCSPKSLFPSPDRSQSLVNRWDLIQTALLNDISASTQLEKAIFGYNRSSPTLMALHAYFDDESQSRKKQDFFSKTLPKMVSLALSLPGLVTQPIPLLKKQGAHCLTLSQQQIACLLANAFFCTFPRRNSSGPNSEYATYPSINFNRLFIGSKTKPKRDKAQIEKIKTILHYFERVTDEMPSGSVTFERRVAPSFPVWNRSPCELQGLHVRKVGLIEDDGKGMLQMDFANKYVGGGVLGCGAVQEEILFCICPELIVSRLFTEVLDDNECLIVTGAERYSSYSGYADTYKWEGDYVDPNSRDSWRRKLSIIVALDATPYWKSATQYRPGNVRRELNKLYCGFWTDVDADFSPAIATGNWGCGAFGGDPVFKALLQLMAAAVVGRDLCYFTFNDDDLMATIHRMYCFIKDSNMTVGDLWNLIAKYNEEEALMSEKQKRPIVENIFEFMQSLHQDYETSTDDGDATPERLGEEG